MSSLVAGIVATILVATAGLLTAPAAQATTCTAVAVAKQVPDVVVTRSGRASARVSVHAVDSCSSNPRAERGVYWVTLTAVNPGKDVVSADLRLASGSAVDGEWTGTLRFTKRSRVGTWFVSVAVTDSDQTIVNSRIDAFRVRRNTLVTLDAERVRKRARVAVSGHLWRLTPTLTYVDFPRRLVNVYFLRAGTTKKVLVGSTRTDGRGRYAKSFAPRRTGQWFVRFPGSTANTGVWSAGDRVVGRG